ncbi:MAG: hypothetical protein GTN82_13015, partial [Candidatus Aminicenantes bacterium]|nr:hypothetical protein [Candidatus Aminicenantes bacterium]
IWISEDEFDDYAKVIGDKNLVVVDPKHQGTKTRILNHIIETEFQKDLDAVCILDDDVQYLGYHENKKRVKMPGDQFIPWLEKY